MDFYDENENEEKTYEQRLEDYAKEKEEKSSDIDTYDNELKRNERINEWENKIKARTTGIKEYYYSDVFFNDDLQVIIVTKDNTYASRIKRSSGTGHGKLAGNILGIDINKYGGGPDVEELIADEYGYVLFSFLSAENEYVPVNLPKDLNLNEYQISELERINEEMKEINIERRSNKKPIIEFNFELYGKEEIKETLDIVIEAAKNNLEEEKTL